MDKNINILEIGSILIHKLWIILLSCILCGLACYVYATYYIDPLYTSDVTMLINSTRVIVDSSGINRYTYETGADPARIISAYSVVVKSNAVLSAVIEKTGLDYSTAQLKSMFNLSPVNGTEVFQIRVSNTDPKMAAKIANSLAEVVPEELKRIVKVGTVEVIDSAVPASRPSSPNVPSTVLIGMAIGVMVAALVIVGFEYLNTTIRSEDELEDKYEIPVIGSIPDATAENMHVYAK